MPKVSIVIPTYNCSKYVTDAINYALNQTYKDIEIIVVDDGSVDNTKATLTPFINQDKIHYIYQKNLGSSKARRTGLLFAKGKYVSFWDADDAWENNFLEEMVNSLEKGDFDWVACDNYRLVIDLNGKIKSKSVQIRPSALEANRNLFTLFLNDDLIGSPSRVLGKKKCFLEANIGKDNLTNRTDWAMWLRMTRCNFKLGVVHKPLCKYIIRENGTNWTRKSKNKWIYETYKLLLQYESKYLQSQNLKRIYSNHLWNLARELFYKKQDFNFVLFLLFKSQLISLSFKRIYNSLLNVYKSLLTIKNNNEYISN